MVRNIVKNQILINFIIKLILKLKVIINLYFMDSYLF